MANHRRIEDEHDVPPWAHELYNNQRLLQARLDFIMADVNQVRADVQAFIGEVESKLDEADTRVSDNSDLQAQLDGIAADLQAARDRLNSRGVSSVPEAPAEPEGEPLPDVTGTF